MAAGSSIDTARYDMNWTRINIPAYTGQKIKFEKYARIKYKEEFNGKIKVNFDIDIQDEPAKMDFVNLFIFKESTGDYIQYLKYNQGQLDESDTKLLNQTLCQIYLRKSKRIAFTNGTL